MNSGKKLQIQVRMPLEPETEERCGGENVDSGDT